MMVKGGTSKKDVHLQKGRAVNAVAELLRRKLSVPNIYLEPRSSYVRVDVLAVDHAGSGDLHAVEIKIEKDFPRNQVKRAANSTDYRSEMANLQKKIRQIHSQILSLPAHYKYLAIPIESKELLIGELAPLGLFSPDGIGRIGLIGILDRGDEAPVAEILSAPERFRMDPAKLGNIEAKVLAKVRPDIEVRV
jgi:hypothetical protein